MAKKKVPPYLLIVWDWKDHPDMMDFNKAISMGYKMFQYLPAEGDDYVVAAVMKPMSRAEQYEAIRKLYAGE